jgi:hypothetical protein
MSAFPVAAEHGMGALDRLGLGWSMTLRVCSARVAMTIRLRARISRFSDNPAGRIKRSCDLGRFRPL